MTLTLRVLGCVAGVAVVAAGPLAGDAGAVAIGTTDTFQSETVNDWYGGTITANVGGGIAGAADRYLTVRTNGNTAGSGSHLAIHNSETRWNGDYTADGVTAISVDLRNLGTTTLNMRMVLFGLGTRFTSTTGVSLAANSGWQHITFPISQATLTRVLGSGTYADTIGSVNQIMFRHDDGTPSSGGTFVNGMVGIDNITAIPAPGAAMVLMCGVGVCAGRRRRVAPGIVGR